MTRRRYTSLGRRFRHLQGSQGRLLSLPGGKSKQELEIFCWVVRLCRPKDHLQANFIHLQLIDRHSIYTWILAKDYGIELVVISDVLDLDHSWKLAITKKLTKFWAKFWPLPPLRASERHQRHIQDTLIDVLYQDTSFDTISTMQF